MKKEIIIGIDVSKATLDICILKNGQSELQKIKNTTKAVKAFFTKLLKANKETELSVCMENTGYYNWPCYEVFESLPINLFVVNPLHLKKSIGLVRGKSDSIDAGRIARFMALHKKELKPTLLARKEVKTIQVLLAQRNRFVETRKRLKVPAQEVVFIGNKVLSRQVEQSSKKVIQELDRQIKIIEEQLNKLIDADPQLKQNYAFITSVQGVGKVLAWTMLVKTNEFKSINNARKLACYAGVVPFLYQSGTSVYKKPQVSFMADKTLKRLLHLCAMRAIQLKGDLQIYYIRKVKEGKNKMSVLNAIRNKIVARICAMVNNKRNYQINLQAA